MAGHEPSWGALVLALLALALVVTSFALPWWSFDSSTGRKTPAGGPQDPSDTRVERHSYDVYPLRSTGDQAPSDAKGAANTTLAIGIAACMAGGALLLALVGEAVRLFASFPRWLSLGALTAAALTLVAGLLITWVLVPSTMSGSGVDGAFTDRLLENNYVRTTLGLGWAAAAIGVLAALGSLAFRFQAGTQEAQAVEAWA